MAKNTVIGIRAVDTHILALQVIVVHLRSFILVTHAVTPGHVILTCPTMASTLHFTATGASSDTNESISTPTAVFPLFGNFGTSGTLIIVRAIAIAIVPSVSAE